MPILFEKQRLRLPMRSQIIDREIQIFVSHCSVTSVDLEVKFTKSYRSGWLRHIILRRGRWEILNGLITVEMHLICFTDCTLKYEETTNNSSYIAWENSLHLAKLPLVYPPNDVWQTRSEIPYWWRVTTQNWVVLLIGRAAWEIWFNQSEALSRSR